jgi:hypothetical protein
MKTEKIIVNYFDGEGGEEDSLDTLLDEFNNECERLHTFSHWERKNGLFYLPGTFANVSHFIRLGGLQKALVNYAFFQQGQDGIPGLSLYLISPYTWEEVISRMKEIKSIEA